MEYLTHVPAAPLSMYIDHFFYYEGYQGGHMMEKFLPDGSVDLLIDLTCNPKKLYHDETGCSYTSLRNSWISGMKTNYILIDGSVSAMIGVHFKPGGCYPFVDFPMEELNNLTIELDTVWGQQAHSLRDAILEQPAAAGKFRLLENFLLEKGKNRLIDHCLVRFAVEQLVRTPQHWTIRRLSQKTGVTPKHLITLFRRYVGLSPKLFSRIQKFQHVIGQIDMQQRVDWSLLSYECGYFDQAHFIRDFRDFSGINPVAYLEKRGPYRNYLPVA